MAGKEHSPSILAIAGLFCLAALVPVAPASSAPQRAPASGPAGSVASADGRDDEPPRLAAAGGISLSAALDATRAWKTGGARKWAGQRALSLDLVDAARAGRVGHRQNSWMSTVVVGPTTVTYWWQTSSEPGDKLIFSIDGKVQATRSGITPWELRSFQIGAGRHTVRWEFRRNARRSAGLNTGFVDQVEIVAKPASAACEGCHGNPAHPGCDGIAGTADDAPNVMGDGTSAAGTGGSPRPFDDGTYGFNVNGHGANGTARRGPTPALAPNLHCTSCHNIRSLSSSKHFDCDPAEGADQRVNTRFFFGKPADTRNANTSHLVAGFLAGADAPQAKQLGFDDYCSTACHGAAGVAQMRHARSDATGVHQGVMEFGNHHDTTDDPKQDRGAATVWTPWTIDDLTNVVDANPPAVRHHGVCVSCHDPHGTATVQKTRLTNKMVIRNWKYRDMQAFCSSNCHVFP